MEDQAIPVLSQMPGGGSGGISALRALGSCMRSCRTGMSFRWVAREPALKGDQGVDQV